jgi:uncharacterized C2H2 Zn-finger protein
MAEKHGENNLQCDSCDFTSATKRAMISHVFKKHWAKCRSGWRMKRQLQAKHETNLFMCNFWDFVARSKSLLVSHKTCAHNMFNLP